MLEIKATNDEGVLLPQIPEIIEFIQSELTRLEKIAKEKRDDRTASWKPLNLEFRRMVSGSKE